MVATGCRGRRPEHVMLTRGRLTVAAGCRGRDQIMPWARPDHAMVTRGRLMVATRCRGRKPEHVMLNPWSTHGRHRVPRTHTRHVMVNPWLAHGRHRVPRAHTRACHGKPVVDSWSPPGAAAAYKSMSW